MIIDKAVESMLLYLLEDCFEIYKLDRAYIRETEKAIVYTYATRLNEVRIKFHNNGNKQYLYCLSYRKGNGTWEINLNQ